MGGPFATKKLIVDQQIYQIPSNPVAGQVLQFDGGLSWVTVPVSGDNVSLFTNDAGYITEHPSISGAASSSDNSGRTYIQDVILDAYGHVIGLETATETVTDTTYTAGAGLDLSGTVFSIDDTVIQSGDPVSYLNNDAGYITEHPATSGATSSDNNGRTYIQDVVLDEFGHVIGISTATETVVDTDTTYTAGVGLDLIGTQFSINNTVVQSGDPVSYLNNDAGYITEHPVTSGTTSSDNSGRTYIQDIILDEFGHVIGLSTATETVVDTDTTYTAGNGLDLSGTEFSVDDTVLRSGDDISWIDYVSNYSQDPYLTGSVPDGEVWVYNYSNENTLYRLVPTGDPPVTDSFYNSWVDPNLSGLVASRGVL